MRVAVHGALDQLAHLESRLRQHELGGASSTLELQGVEDTSTKNDLVDAGARSVPREEALDVGWRSGRAGPPDPAFRSVGQEPTPVPKSRQPATPVGHAGSASTAGNPALGSSGEASGSTGAQQLSDLLRRRGSGDSEQQQKRAARWFEASAASSTSSRSGSKENPSSPGSSQPGRGTVSLPLGAPSEAEVGLFVSGVSREPRAHVLKQPPQPPQSAGREAEALATSIATPLDDIDGRRAFARAQRDAGRFGSAQVVRMSPDDENSADYSIEKHYASPEANEIYRRSLQDNYTGILPFPFDVSSAQKSAHALDDGTSSNKRAADESSRRRPDREHGSPSTSSDHGSSSPVSASRVKSGEQDGSASVEVRERSPLISNAEDTTTSAILNRAVPGHFVVHDALSPDVMNQAELRSLSKQSNESQGGRGAESLDRSGARMDLVSRSKEGGKVDLQTWTLRTLAVQEEDGQLVKAATTPAISNVGAAAPGHKRSDPSLDVASGGDRVWGHDETAERGTRIRGRPRDDNQAEKPAKTAPKEERSEAPRHERARETASQTRSDGGTGTEDRHARAGDESVLADHLERLGFPVPSCPSSRAMAKKTREEGSSNLYSTQGAVGGPSFANLRETDEEHLRKRPSDKASAAAANAIAAGSSDGPGPTTVAHLDGAAALPGIPIVPSLGVVVPDVVVSGPRGMAAIGGATSPEVADRLALVHLVPKEHVDGRPTSQSGSPPEEPRSHPGIVTTGALAAPGSPTQMGLQGSPRTDTPLSFTTEVSIELSGEDNAPPPVSAEIPGPLPNLGGERSDHSVGSRYGANLTLIEGRAGDISDLDVALNSRASSKMYSLSLSVERTLSHTAPSQKRSNVDSLLHSIASEGHADEGSSMGGQAPGLASYNLASIESGGIASGSVSRVVSKEGSDRSVSVAAVGFLGSGEGDHPADASVSMLGAPSGASEEEGAPASGLLGSAAGALDASFTAGGASLSVGPVENRGDAGIPLGTIAEDQDLRAGVPPLAATASLNISPSASLPDAAEISDALLGTSTGILFAATGGPWSKLTADPALPSTSAGRARLPEGSVSLPAGLDPAIKAALLSRDAEGASPLSKDELAAYLQRLKSDANAKSVVADPVLEVAGGNEEAKNDSEDRRPMSSTSSDSEDRQKKATASSQARPGAPVAESPQTQSVLLDRARLAAVRRASLGRSSASSSMGGNEMTLDILPSAPGEEDPPSSPDPTAGSKKEESDSSTGKGKKAAPPAGKSAGKAKGKLPPPAGKGKDGKGKPEVPAAKGAKGKGAPPPAKGAAPPAKGAKGAPPPAGGAKGAKKGAGKGTAGKPSLNKVEEPPEAKFRKTQIPDVAPGSLRPLFWHPLRLDASPEKKDENTIWHVIDQNPARISQSVLQHIFAVKAVGNAGKKCEEAGAASGGLKKHGNGHLLRRQKQFDIDHGQALVQKVLKSTAKKISVFSDKDARAIGLMRAKMPPLGRLRRNFMRLEGLDGTQLGLLRDAFPSEELLEQLRGQAREEEERLSKENRTLIEEYATNYVARLVRGVEERLASALPLPPATILEQEGGSSSSTSKMRLPDAVAEYVRERMAAQVERRMQRDEEDTHALTDSDIEVMLDLATKPSLEPVERYCLDLLNIPCFRLRLKVWLICYDFAEFFADIEKNATYVLHACDFLQQDPVLISMFNILVHSGNILNAGSAARERADGFALEILQNIKSVKTTKDRLPDLALIKKDEENREKKRRASTGGFDSSAKKPGSASRERVDRAILAQGEASPLLPKKISMPDDTSASPADRRPVGDAKEVDSDKKDTGVVLPGSTPNGNSKKQRRGRGNDQDGMSSSFTSDDSDGDDSRARREGDSSTSLQLPPIGGGRRAVKSVGGVPSSAVGSASSSRPTSLSPKSGSPQTPRYDELGVKFADDFATITEDPLAFPSVRDFCDFLVLSAGIKEVGSLFRINVAYGAESVHEVVSKAARFTAAELRRDFFSLRSRVKSAVDALKDIESNPEIAVLARSVSSDSAKGEDGPLASRSASREIAGGARVVEAVSSTASATGQQRSSSSSSSKSPPGSPSGTSQAGGPTPLAVMLEKRAYLESRQPELAKLENVLGDAEKRFEAVRGYLKDTAKKRDYTEFFGLFKSWLKDVEESYLHVKKVADQLHAKHTRTRRRQTLAEEIPSVRRKLQKRASVGF
ncbi:unnamed protein product [Amoebophrya sp. A25]|nr:unnamed protein product [Amoebophrya sp. A25]|eukprot:GSA25T00011745001.1